MNRPSVRRVLRLVRGIAIERAGGRRPAYLNRISMWVILLAACAAVRAEDCAPGTFDYGPSYGEEAEQIVLDHHGPEGPVLPVPEDCARTVRDLALIRAGYPEFAGATHAPGDYERNFITIRTDAPEDPDLVCMNLYYQVSYGPVYAGSWGVTFPRSVNVYAMGEIYSALPAVLYASTNVYGCGAVGGGCCAASRWSYSVHAHGVWRWTFWSIGGGGGHGGCREHVSNFYVSETGWVLRLFPPQRIDLEQDPVSDVARAGAALEAGNSADGVVDATDVSWMAALAEREAVAEPAASEVDAGANPATAADIDAAERP